MKKLYREASGSAPCFPALHELNYRYPCFDRLNEMLLPDLQIDPDIPVPRGRTLYPFREMEVGDSIFFAELAKGTSARVASSHFCKTHEPTWHFTLRKVDKGFRLWRTA